VKALTQHPYISTRNLNYSPGDMLPKEQKENEKLKKKLKVVQKEYEAMHDENVKGKLYGRKQHVGAKNL
jgi:hypothetical protein